MSRVRAFPAPNNYCALFGNDNSLVGNLAAQEGIASAFGVDVALVNYSTATTPK